MLQQKKLHALEKEMRHWKQQQEQLLDEDLQEDPQDEQSEDPQDEQSEEQQDEPSEDPQDEQYEEQHEEEVVKLLNHFFSNFLIQRHENYYYHNINCNRNEKPWNLFWFS